MRLSWVIITSLLMGWWVVFMGAEKANPTITAINSLAGIYFDEM
jgi:hypothetical protein